MACLENYMASEHFDAEFSGEAQNNQLFKKNR